MRVARRLLVPAILVLAFSAIGAAPATATATAAGTATAAASSGAPPGWNQFGYSAAHAGYNPRETRLATTNAGSLATRWTARLGAANDFLSSPVVAGGRLFVQAWDGNLFALRASTGKVIWSATVGAYAGGFSPALWRGDVIATAQVDGGSVIAAFNAASGKLRWKTSLAGQGFGATPAISGDTIFFSTGPYIYAVSARSGAIRWKTTIADDPDSSGVFGPVAVSGDGKHVLAAGVDGSVYNLSAATGQIGWQVQAGGGIYRGGPAIDGGVAYVPEGSSGAEGGGFDIVALRLSDGAALWRGFAGDDVHTTPAVAYGMVFIGAIDTGFRALDARTGALRWAIESTPEVWSQPAVANGVVYQATESSLYAVDAKTGRQLFLTEFGEGNANMSGAVVWAGRVYMASGDDAIRAFALP